MLRPLLLAGVGSLGLALLSGQRAAPAASTGERSTLRGEARGILGTYCGRCHDGKLATAKPSAMAIFDLSKLDWADGLSDERLDHLLGRMDSFGVPEPSRVRLRAFVDAEKRARR